jgi:multiple sugar transport system permease protein
MSLGSRRIISQEEVRTVNPKIRRALPSNIIAFILSIAWWVPVVWMIVISFKPARTNVVSIADWISPPFTLDNYIYVLNNDQANIGLWFFNSLLVALVATAGTLILGTLAAFAFSRIRFFGKTFWFWIIMASLMIPGETTLIPLYVLMRDLKLLNTYASLILPGLSSAFTLIVMKQFIDALPNELFEAARIDGARWGRMLWSIVLPLCKPALASLGIFIFLGSWNNFLWPYISITDPKLMTLPVGLPFFRSQYNADMAYPMAANSLASIPALVAFFIFQKRIIKGITFSGMKI